MNADSLERQAHNSDRPWLKSWPGFAAVMRELIGTDLPSAIAKYLGKVTAQNVRDWRRGEAGIPAWVRDLMRQRVQERQESLAQWKTYLDTMPVGPGTHSNLPHIRSRREHSPTW